MVVHSPPAGTLALVHVGKSSDVPPVVVAEEDRHVVRGPKTFVVVVLHFFVERPHLRHFCRALAGLALDDGALVRNYGAHQLEVSSPVHRFVAVAAHTDRHDVFGILHATDSLGEELVENILVRLVVPHSELLTAARPLLVVARHRLVVGGSHHDTHRVHRLDVFRIVSIVRPAPHRRPEEIAAQTEYQLADALIEPVVAIVRAVSVLDPTCEAWRFVVEEDSAIAYCGLAVRVRALGDCERIVPRQRRVRPVVPRRNSDLLGKLVYPVDRASPVAAGDDQRLFHPGHRIFRERDDICLALAIKGGVDLCDDCSKAL